MRSATYADVSSFLADELRRPPWRGAKNPMAGHCYVASEAAYHIMGSRFSRWRPMWLRHEGASHWYLQHDSGLILDITANQFTRRPDYTLGRGKGFLTLAPSKRAMIVMERYYRSMG